MTGKYLHKNEQNAKLPRVSSIAVHTLLRCIIGLLVASIILLNLFTHVLLIVHYTGNSMEPNLSNGQTLILAKTTDVAEGDVIAFYFNNQVLVRRVVCTGGNRITVRRDGAVLINDEPVEEPYVAQPSLGQCSISFPYYVQNGYVFVMGDNREISMDSRLEEIGAIPERRIIGKVLFSF
ncbi:MAG: signal peptidase I [Oscillospiraceae bacterium]|nr:signal peptidase I [Oscillospiraceae bacterium]